MTAKLHAETAKVIIDIITGKKPARAMLTAPSSERGIAIPGRDPVVERKGRSSSEAAISGVEKKPGKRPHNSTPCDKGHGHG